MLKPEDLTPEGAITTVGKNNSYESETTIVKKSSVQKNNHGCKEIGYSRTSNVLKMIMLTLKDRAKDLKYDYDNRFWPEIRRLTHLPLIPLKFVKRTFINNNN